MTKKEIWRRLTVNLLSRTVNLPAITTYQELNFDATSWGQFCMNDVGQEFGYSINPAGLTTVGELAAAIYTVLNAAGGAAPARVPAAKSKRPKRQPVMSDLKRKVWQTLTVKVLGKTPNLPATTAYQGLFPNQALTVGELANRIHEVLQHVTPGESKPSKPKKPAAPKTAKIRKASGGRSTTAKKAGGKSN